MSNYSTDHKRVVRQRGPASSYTCIACSEPAADWAFQHKTKHDKEDTASYSPMCRKCHGVYDLDTRGAAISAAKQGVATRPCPPEVRDAISRGWSGESRSDAADRARSPEMRWARVKGGLAASESPAHTGYKLSQATKDKMSSGQKARRAREAEERDYP